MSVQTGWPGCVHDARVLRNSGLFQQAERGELTDQGKFLVADSAYPLKAWLTTTYKNYPNLTPQQRLFNRRLAAMRQVVERAIGHLKGRFGRLKQVHLYDIEAACKLIFAAEDHIHAYRQYVDFHFTSQLCRDVFSQLARTGWCHFLAM